MSEVKQVQSLQDLEALESKIDGGTPPIVDNKEVVITKTEEELRLESEAKIEADRIAEEERIKNTSTTLKVEDVVSKAEAEGLEVLTVEERNALIEAGYNLGEPSDSDDFLTSLETVTGEVIEVDLGSDSINTPEGMSKYLEAYADKKIADFEKALAENYPNAYKAFQIEIDGGDAAAYFNSSSSEEVGNYLKQTFDEEDTAQHKQILADALRLKGVDESDVRDFIKLAEDTNQLESKARKEFGFLKSVQEEDRRNYEISIAKQREADEKQMGSMSEYLSGIVNTGVLDNFNIPTNDKAKFLTHLKENIYFDKGEFFITKKVDNSNVGAILKQEFFNYRKGDIVDLINKGVTKKLTLTLKKNIASSNSGVSSKGGNSGHKTLGEI